MQAQVSIQSIKAHTARLVPNGGASTSTITWSSEDMEWVCWDFFLWVCSYNYERSHTIECAIMLDPQNHDDNYYYP